MTDKEFVLKYHPTFYVEKFELLTGRLFFAIDDDDCQYSFALGKTEEDAWKNAKTQILADINDTPASEEGSVKLYAGIVKIEMIEDIIEKFSEKF